MINTIVLDMPTTITSLVRANTDDTYTIILNARMSSEAQRKAYLHEIEHIRNNDYERTTADLIEFYAHKKTNVS